MKQGGKISNSLSPRASLTQTHLDPSIDVAKIRCVNIIVGKASRNAIKKIDGREKNFK